MNIPPGSRLGVYEVVAALGSGGMGEVYRARDTRLDRTVAIKVLPQSFRDNPGLKTRFRREAQLISSLNDPHICALYDVGEQDGVDFLVMEHVEGQTRPRGSPRAPPSATKHRGTRSTSHQRSRPLTATTSCTAT